MSSSIVVLREVFCVHRTNEGDAAALQGTSIAVSRGEVLCVHGPSGAGKSTLLRVIAGIQVPSAGIVQVLGHDIGRLPARARARLRHERLGLLGQHTETALPPDLRVGQAVALPLAVRGVGARDRAARVDELLDAAGMRGRADALPSELSGGERQRVALCAALAHRPELLLADEPTAELDERSADAVRSLIVGLARMNGTTAVIASHDPATASIADRAVRIRDGRVVEDRSDGVSALVVGRGGWIRLPSELLAEAGIADRAVARPVPGGVMLTGAGHRAAATGTPTAAPAAVRSAAVRSANATWSAAEAELRSVERTLGHGSARRRVLVNFSLSFKRGAMNVVTGRSGSGKTTLLRLLAGLDQPDHGDVLVDGAALGALDGDGLAALRRERIGYLPQEPSPIGFLSAHENVELALAIRGWDGRLAAERAAVALAHVGLADRSRQRVARLSAGEAQRVALARALASARGLLIVDEPTSRLDEASAQMVAALLEAAAEEDGQTVICATHDPEVIRRCQEVVALENL